MTLALGLTEAAGAPADAIIAEPAHLAIIAAPAERARTPRDRLALQVTYARNLRSFLPFKVRTPLSVADAARHVTADSERLGAMVHARRGLVQITVALTKPEDEAAPPGESWLRRRAVASRHVADRTAHIADKLSRLGASSTHRDDRNGLVHLVGDEHLLPRVRSALATAPDRPGWGSPQAISVIVTGPWPVFANVAAGVAT